MDTGDPLPLLFALKEFNSAIIFQSVTILILLAVSGLIAASEIAFFSLSPTDVRALEDSKAPGSKRVLKILDRPKHLLATVLLGSNLINIAVIILFAELIETLFAFNPGQEYVRFLIDAVFVTFLLLLVSEVVPKVYANQNPYKVATIMAIPVQFLINFLRPLSWILLSSTSIIDKRFKKRNQNITVDELGHALELTFKNQSSEEEKRILQGIVRFGNTSASQIMKPRMDVEAINQDITFDELVPLIINCGYSRLPVYKESIDHINGVLVAKDLLPYLDRGADFDWRAFIRPPFFVPDQKKIDDLLSDFRKDRTHLAVVVDEYGGTLGIITLEDVLEEIVGDISDEFDDEDITYTKIDDFNYVFEGKTHLTDIYKVLKIDGDDFEKKRGEADTLAGFLLEISGRFLHKNEKIKFERYLFTVEAADKRRIKQVKITIGDVYDQLERSLNVKTSFVLIPLLFLLVACGGGNTTAPRPRGYFRIHLPVQVYDTIDPIQPFTALKNKAALFVRKNDKPGEENFSVLDYPGFKATFFITYVAVDTNLSKLINDCHALAYNHTGKADDIVPVMVRHPENKVYGLIYEFKGNAATPLQFYVTDSTDNFLRGSLYFYAKPNYDSVQPVLDYVRKDLDKTLSTLQWKKQVPGKK